MHTFKLNTGAEIPAVGLGTWQSPPGGVKAAVLCAIKAGYRHIDAAFAYGNEAEVGQALAEAMGSGVVRREELFVTTKLWNSYHRRAEACLDQSLQNLGLDYVDLYLMHWPVPLSASGNHDIFPTRPDGSRDIDGEWSHVQTWQALEALAQTPKVRAIGVSNYSVKYLEELLGQASVVPAANQIENHPYLPQLDVYDFCKAKGILVEAYSPLGSTGGPLMKDQRVQALADKYGVGPGTILISYQVGRGNVVLPKSVTPSRIQDNLKVVDLHQDDIASLDGIHKTEGVTRYVYPPFGVNLGFPDKQ